MKSQWLHVSEKKDLPVRFGEEAARDRVGDQASSYPARERGLGASLGVLRGMDWGYGGGPEIYRWETAGTLPVWEKERGMK